MKPQKTINVECVWDDGADTSLGLPFYATAGAAGADLRANLPDRKSMHLLSGGRVLVPTGLRVSVPHGFEMQIRPRSGLALNHGITLANTPGTVDSDYRGPLGVILFNAGAETFEVTHGMRIAQMVISPVVQAEFVNVELLSDTARAAGGFGSTGVGR